MNRNDNMEKYTKALEILFKNISVYEILKNPRCYEEFSKNTFLVLTSNYIDYYSNDEIENMYNYFSEEYPVNQKRFFGERWSVKGLTEKVARNKKEEGLRIFDILLVFANYMLLEDNGEPVCDYSHLLRWRMSAHKMEEDLFITAFLAYKDLNKSRFVRDFRWELVIGTNNRALRELLKKGIAENHFHLKGSAPYFHLSWLSLMNKIDSPNFANIWDRYEKQRLNSDYDYNASYQTYSLCQMHRQAALIRLVLFMKLREQRMILEKVWVNYERIKNVLDLSELEQYKVSGTRLYEIWKEDFAAYTMVSLLELLEKANKERAIENANKTDCQKEVEDILAQSDIQGICSSFLCDESTFDEWRGTISLEELLYYVLRYRQNIVLEDVARFIPDDACRGIEEEFTLKYIYDILADPVKMQQKLPEIQILIETQRQEQSQHSSDHEKTDYALRGIKTDYNKQDSIRNILMGERWLLYQIFQKYFCQDSKYSSYFNLFYLYLVIKEKIRAEMIQVNSNVGFSNFAIYQARKEDFVEGTCFEKGFLKLAVADSMRRANLVSLEARISPKENWLENVKRIKKNDKLSGLTKEEQKRMFYVYHFVKMPEEESEFTKDDKCHHERLRGIVKKQAQAITMIREKDPKTAQRILGIDGCNAEIGCRPEVFACAYRYLRNYVPVDATGKKTKVPSLGLTYHVGEDFLDLVDGLRAIEEACRFLELRCGDRFGHALALGVDVKDWYASKMNRVVVSKQEYLDNLVWVYTKIRQIGMMGYEDLLLYIEKEYGIYFREVYLDNISESHMNGALLEYMKNTKENISERISEFDIHTYYRSWKLRGDDPACYKSGSFKLPAVTNYGWDMFRISNGNVEDFKIKKKFESAFLYYNYHYNSKVKCKGREIIEVKITPKMQQAVEFIQLEMQKKIAKMGIEIEVNPSSNYLIGTFKRYDRHPILNFYNLGLETDSEKIRRCPQISVSINTDDQGVFATSLENEYALMLQAVERICDEDGNPMYSRAMIYQWLDQIRENGIQQSFLKNRE